MFRYTRLLIIFTLMLVVPLFATGCGSSITPRDTVEQQPTQTNDLKNQQQAKLVKEPSTKDLGKLEFVSSKDNANGCISCHTKTADKDYSLTAEMNAMNKKFGHPKMEISSPNDCVSCHKDGEKSLDKVLHKVHLVGNENKFVTNYKGSCVNCHGLTTESTIAVKGLSEDVKFTPIKSKSANLGKANCAACHTNTADKDYSLTAEMEAMNKEFGHPKQEINSGKDCLSCHGENNPLSNVLHVKHLTGKENKFITDYGGSCRNCHAIYDNGEIKAKF